MKNNRPLVLMNKTLQKRSIHNNRYATYNNSNNSSKKNINNKITNENKNLLNMFRPKFCQKGNKSNDKSLKKIQTKNIIETSFKLKRRENYPNKFETLNHYRCPTTISTNLSSNKEKQNKSISNNKRTMKKHLLINSEAFSTNDTLRLRNNLTMQSNFENKENITYHHKKNNLERSRSGRKEGTQKSTPASLVPSTTTDKNNKININLNEKKFQDILKTSKFNFECQNKLKDIKNNLNIDSNKNSNNIRSINDIKKECLATMRASEKVQNQILKQGEKILNTLEKRYFLLNNKLPQINLSLQENINNINLGIFSTTFMNTEENFGSKNNFTSDEYKQLLDTFNMIEYGPSILDEYFIEQENIKNVLEKHTITPQMRLKMVDWMVEIFTIIQTNDITFFTAVNVMDKFFDKSEISYQPSDLHLIGICSIFIASKFCDINPIRLKFLIEKIGHGKFNKDQIIKMEETILSTLQYDILKPTIYDFTSFFFEDLFFFYENNFNIKNPTIQNYLKQFIESHSNCIDLALRRYNFGKYETITKFTDNLRNFIKCILIYLLKMCCQDYEIMNEKKGLISASCIVVAMKICEQINKDKYIDEFFMERLQHLSRENIYNIMELSSKILFRAQNYEKFYPGVKHLYKTHFENLTRMQNTK